MGKSLRVGKYVPKRKLRQVADFYTVYEATQVGLQRSVQLRILTTDLDEDATAHARFTYQFKSLAQLDHPGILRVHDIGVYEGGLFFVTDHRDSSSLRELLTTKGRFDSEFLLETTKSLARALAYLHGRGILHRDLRLDTVAYDRETESVYIDDFSLVRNFNLKALSQIGIREMLPFVRVPELELSIPFDEKTDLYLLGKLLYEAAKAEPLLPLSREDLTTPGKLAAPEIHGTDLPEDFIRVIQRCLEPHPLKRYRSAEELLGDLDKIEDRISMKSALVEMVESSRSLKIAQFRNIKKPEKEPSEESDPSVHDAETADHPETSDERKSSLEGEREATAGVTASHSHPLFPETKSLSPRPRPSPEQLKGAPTFMIFAFALGAIVGLAVFVASARRTMTSTKGLVATDFPGRSTTADSGLDDRPRLERQKFGAAVYEEAQTAKVEPTTPDTFPNRWGLLDQWHRQLRTEKRTRFPFNEVLLANLAMKYRQDSEEACKLIDMLFGSSLDYLAKFPPGKPPDPDPGPLTLAPDPDP